MSPSTNTIYSSSSHSVSPTKEPFPVHTYTLPSTFTYTLPSTHNYTLPSNTSTSNCYASLSQLPITAPLNQNSQQTFEQRHQTLSNHSCLTHPISYQLTNHNTCSVSGLPFDHDPNTSLQVGHRHLFHGSERTTNCSTTLPPAPASCVGAASSAAEAANPADPGAVTGNDPRELPADPSSTEFQENCKQLQVHRFRNCSNM